MPKLVPTNKLLDYGIDLKHRQRRRLEAANEFPRRIQVTGRRFAYVESEILKFIETKVAAARDAHSEIVKPRRRSA